MLLFRQIAHSTFEFDPASLHRVVLRRFLHEVKVAKRLSRERAVLAFQFEFALLDAQELGAGLIKHANLLRSLFH